MECDSKFQKETGQKKAQYIRPLQFNRTIIHSDFRVNSQFRYSETFGHFRYSEKFGHILYESFRFLKLSECIWIFFCVVYRASQFILGFCENVYY